MSPTKMLFLLRNIIRDIGLDPAKFTRDWAIYENGISTWLASRHLERVTAGGLRPRRPTTLVTRWDIDVVYRRSATANLWVDAAAVRYAITQSRARRRHPASTTSR